LIDSRSEESHVSQYKISEDLFDTHLPANTDDADLNPRMTAIPSREVASRWTDMTVALVRFEVWKMSRRLQSLSNSGQRYDDPAKRLAIFQQFQANIEETYLKQLQPDQPLHIFTAANARLFLSKLDLMLFMQSQNTKGVQSQRIDPSNDDRVFTLSLSIVEYTYALQHETGWFNGWRWQMAGQQPPWNALHLVLTRLSKVMPSERFDRALSAAKNTLGSLGEEAHRDPRYQQLLMLAANAQWSRSAEPSRQRSGMPAPVESSNIRDPRPQAYGRETLPTTAESLVDNSSYLNEVDSNMDWHGWDDFTWELDPDMWNVPGL